MTREWTILKVKHPCACKLKELFQDVKSRRKRETGLDLDEENLEYLHTDDDEGRVDSNQERILEHQDHFVLIAQDKASAINEEEAIDIQDLKRPFKEFLRIRRWRKIMRIEDVESGGERNPPLHPIAVPTTVNGSLPALEASTEVEGGRGDDPSTTHCHKSYATTLQPDFQPVLGLAWHVEEGTTIEEGIRQRHYEGRIRFREA
jgi:hypothetical protein